MSRVVVENLDGSSPRRSLRAVDLTQVEDVALHDAAAGNALVLDHTPIVVCLAILLSLGLPQKHDTTNLAVGIRRREQGRSSLQPISAVLAKYSVRIPFDRDR
jgi:hypothetical protein